MGKITLIIGVITLVLVGGYYLLRVPASNSIIDTRVGAINKTTALEEEVALAKDYVLANCLIQKYRGTPIASEAEVWAGGLVEKGNQPAETYPKLAKIAQAEAPEPGISQNGTLMRMQSCVELYNNPTIQAEIRLSLSE